MAETYETEHNGNFGERLAKLEVYQRMQLDTNSEIKNSMRETKQDIKSILAILNQGKGGWKVIAAMSAVSGAVGGIVGSLARFLQHN